MTEPLLSQRLTTHSSSLGQTEQKALRPAGKIRVLIVDDSVVMRSLISRILRSDPEIEVVGSARDGVNALAKVAALMPDLVTLDVDMPEMDGLEALRQMQRDFPKVRVIMCSSLTEKGAAVTVDALLSGASDYVTKQQSSSTGEGAYDSLRVDLLTKIGQIFQGDPAPRAAASVSAVSAMEVAAGAPQANPAIPQPMRVAGTTRASCAPELVAIGVSTGGPSALAEIIPMLPAGFPLPVVIVQHMPPVFTQLLAERLDRISAISVCEAVDGMELKGGLAVVAPGNFHMRVVRKRGELVVELNQQAPENSCRPAVDVLFRSVAETSGAAAIAVVLTGMGQDGLLGARSLRAKGTAIVVQDQATSVVWGMPGAVANANLANAVLPLGEIIPELLRRL